MRNIGGAAPSGHCKNTRDSKVGGWNDAAAGWLAAALREHRNPSPFFRCPYIPAGYTGWQV